MHIVSPNPVFPGLGKRALGDANAVVLREEASGGEPQTPPPPPRQETLRHPGPPAAVNKYLGGD